jgi:mono/diheme cytochrome c family protein
MRGAACLLAALWLPTLGAWGAASFDEPSLTDQAKAQARGRALYQQRVEPMLRTKCLGCHGDGEELDGDLDLRGREAMLRGGKSGPALVPGDPVRSAIYQAVRRTDERTMPPKERPRLSAEEIDDLREWIEAGAP